MTDTKIYDKSRTFEEHIVLLKEKLSGLYDVKSEKRFNDVCAIMIGSNNKLSENNQFLLKASTYEIISKQEFNYISMLEISKCKSQDD